MGSSVFTEGPGFSLGGASVFTMGSRVFTGGPVLSLQGSRVFTMGFGPGSSKSGGYREKGVERHVG